LKAAGNALASFGKEIGSAMGNMAKISAKAMTAATVAAGGAVVKLTKDATAAYGNYQQLVGGVETLFKTSADKVMQYANDAYKTAGLSANEYMDTVTSFSASLLQGLGGDTEKAAKIADMAIRDMSDNANKMGTSMESIQNAYQGFAKQNYTMLDNLKLGYGGTAGEMARLINESGVLGESMKVTDKTVKSVSFDKMIEAINIVQQRMGITGTTAKEAGDTITGSLSSVKAAWQNVVTAMGDKKGDVSGKLNDLVKTVSTFAKNVIPTIMSALKGVGTLVKELAPVIINALPDLFNDIVPELVTTIGELVPVIVDAMKNLVAALAEQLPTLLPILVTAWQTFFYGIIDALDSIIDTLIPLLPDIINTICDTLLKSAPKLVEAGMKLLVGLLKGIADNIDRVIDTISKLIPIIVNAIIDNLPQILEAGGRILFALIKGILDNLPQIIQAIIDVIAALLVEIWNHLPEIFEAGVDLIVELASGIGSAFSEIGDKISELFSMIGDWFADRWKDLQDWGGDIIEGIANGIGAAVSLVTEKIGGIWQAVKDFFKGVWEEAVHIGENLIEGIVEGITTAKDVFVGALTDDFFDNWITGFKDIFGISSPSKVMRDEVGKYLAEGIAVGFEDEMKNVNRIIGDSVQTEFDVNTNGAQTTGAKPQSQVIVMRLVDGYGRIVAEGVTNDVNELQGQLVSFGERGLAM
jgi:phage-related protein